MAAPYSEGQVRLRDGRTVAYAEFGDPAGVPVLNCHGVPSSRRERYWADGDAYAARGVRLIGVDRPGFGGSDEAPRRRVVDWPDDAAQALDALGVDQVHVLALSGGVPYAFALAHAFPDRVHRVATIGASPPPDIPWRWPSVPPPLRSLLLRPGPVSTTAWLPLMGPVALRPPLMLAFLRLRLSPADRAVLERPEVRQLLDETFSEGVQQGWRPGAYGRALLLRPWGFPVAEVPRPVQLWHGTADWQAPLLGARLLAAAMPTAELRVIPGAGHLLGFDHAADVLTALTAP